MNLDRFKLWIRKRFVRVKKLRPRWVDGVREAGQAFGSRCKSRRALRVAAPAAGEAAFDLREGSLGREVGGAGSGGASSGRWKLRRAGIWTGSGGAVGSDGGAGASTDAGGRSGGTLVSLPTRRRRGWGRG